VTMDRRRSKRPAVGVVMGKSNGTRVATFATLIALSACCARDLAGQILPTTRPAQPRSTQSAKSEAISDLIEKLGDSDPGVREQAGRALWAKGHDAEPALREAANSPYPEVARRASAILRDFTYGLYPDTPPAIFDLLNQYRKGDPQQKRMAVWAMGSNGFPGVRVLLKLREEEHDPNFRQMISQALLSKEHDAIVTMLADGEVSGIEKILEHAAADSPGAAQDYVALLLLNGELPAKMTALKAQPLTPATASLQALMARAAGDLTTAREAAEKSNDSQLLESVLVDQDDWTALAARLSADGQGLRPPERLGFLCAYYRLAGDADASAKAAADLVEQARRIASDYPLCARNLFLNGKPGQGVSVLLDHHDYLRAADYLAPRLRIREALELPALAAKNQPAAAIQVKARTVGTLEFAGKTDQAQSLMVEVARENRLRNDFPTWTWLVEGAASLGMQAVADDYAASALAKGNNQTLFPSLFEKLRLGDGSAATLWWLCLRHGHNLPPPADSLSRLRAIFSQTLRPEQWSELDEAARQSSADLQEGSREYWEQVVAQTFTDAGQEKLARQWVHRLARSSNPIALIHAGDFEAAKSEWAAAAGDYDKAWKQDRTQAAALFLHGWVLVQSGHQTEGQAQMELAHRLPLGNAAARYAMVEALSRHNLNQDVRRELDLILRITSPQSAYRNEAMRLTAADLAAKGDHLRAAALLERAFLQNLTQDIFWTDQWGNVVMPALVHRMRAVGLIETGQIEAGIKEAGIGLEQSPSDADALIEVVSALDKSGHKSQADALYERQTSVYRKFITDYPNSGPGHNQLAWSQVMCHREPEDALKNAKRAVELEPSSTASLDTLAEVYFAQGNVANAAAQMKRCIELEPQVKRHRKQLARFETAVLPTTQP
jgi:tetratricopeptide (TPR) repeat protein